MRYCVFLSDKLLTLISRFQYVCTCVQYLCSTLFLDGRTSMLVFICLYWVPTVQYTHSDSPTLVTGSVRINTVLWL